jgi:hypothetical protein
MELADNSTLQWGLGDFTVAVVTRYTNPAGTYGALWTKASDNNGACPCPGAALFANDGYDITKTSPTAQVTSSVSDSVTGTPAGLNDGKLHVIVVRRSGQTALEIRVDGTSTLASIASIDVSARDASVGLGASATGSYAWDPGRSQLLDGDLAQVIAVQGTVSDTEMAQLEGYLKAKYGL